MKKVLLYFLFVALGTIGLDLSVTFVLERIIPKSYHSTLFNSDELSSDIVILGASRAVRHYNPQIISDSLNCSVGVYGKLSQNIYFQYAVLEALLEHATQKPTILLLEVSKLDIIDIPGSNTERLNDLFPFYYSEPAVKNLLSDVLDKKELFMVKASGLYRYNSKILLYLGRFISKQQKPTIVGYSPLKDICNIPPVENSMEKQSINIECLDSVKIKYIEKLINKCKQEKIQLLFTDSPRFNFRVTKEPLWKEKIKLIAKENNIPVLDYEKDSIFLQHREWFYDNGHLNKTGSNNYSQRIVLDLRKYLHL